MLSEPRMAGKGSALLQDGVRSLDYVRKACVQVTGVNLLNFASKGKRGSGGKTSSQN